MTMTDPVADMLTRLRNANSAHHDAVSLPSSKLKKNIAEILKREGYISEWKIEDARVGETLTIDLKYGPERERSIAGIKRVSKPVSGSTRSRRRSPRSSVASAWRILSTSSGLLTDREAEQKGVGGEVLAYVW